MYRAILYKVQDVFCTTRYNVTRYFGHCNHYYIWHFLTVFNRKQKEAPKSASHLIRTVMRVGALAKGLVLRDELKVHLVVVCSEKPTRTLLETVADRLTKQLQVTYLLTSTLC